MRRGFTLVEVLVSIALLGVITGAMFGFVIELVGKRDRLVLMARDGRAGAVLFERIEADVLCGLAGDSRHGAGVQGTAGTLRLLTRGVGAAASTGEAARALAGLHVAEYSFDAGGTRVRVRRGPAGGDLGEAEVVHDHVGKLRFRYFDGRAWADAFDSGSAGKLPVAIEVGLWFDRPAVEPGASVEEAEEFGTFSEEVPDQEPVRLPAPDRERVIIVPDGPVAAWKEGS